MKEYSKSTKEFNKKPSCYKLKSNKSKKDKKRRKKKEIKLRDKINRKLNLRINLSQRLKKWRER